MSVTTAQIETTFDIELNGAGYTVTRLEDMNSGYISYEVFDDNGDLINDELEDEVITYLEENS
jgi:hypothetical protein